MEHKQDCTMMKLKKTAFGNRTLFESKVGRTEVMLAIGESWRKDIYLEVTTPSKYGTFSFPIKYCPCCGEKMTDEESEPFVCITDLY